MKLTKEQLKRIISEELEVVLNEFHSAIDNDNNDSLVDVEEEEEDITKPEQISPAQLAAIVTDTLKDLKDPEVQKAMKGKDASFAAQAIKRALATATKPGSNEQEAIALAKASDKIMHINEVDVRNEIKRNATDQ